MDTKLHVPTQDEKPTTPYEDKAELSSDKQHIVLENADYAGAEAKTDPAEIALVRKIDWRLMVCSANTESFNPKSNSCIANTMYNVLSQLCRQKRHRTSAPE